MGLRMSRTAAAPVQGEPSSAAEHATPPAPPPLTLTKLNHFAIDVDDVPSARDFYVHVLGFRRAERPDLGFPGVWLEAPDMMLHIIQRDTQVPMRFSNWTEAYEETPRPWMLRRSVHLAFEVASVDDAERALRQHGVEYHRQENPEFGIAQLFLFDPEGHGIEILEQHGASPSP